MSDIVEDGGPAFPRPTFSNPTPDRFTGAPDYVPGHDGMSLREWLAGKALSGVLSNQDFIIRVLNYDNPVRPSDNSQKLFDEAAALAVRAADATLKELNKA